MQEGLLLLYLFIFFLGRTSFERLSEAQFLDILYLQPLRSVSFRRVSQMFGVSVTMADGETEPYQEARNWPRDCSEPAVKVPHGSSETRAEKGMLSNS